MYLILRFEGCCAPPYLQGTNTPPQGRHRDSQEGVPGVDRWTLRGDRWYSKIWTVTCKIDTLDYFLTPCTKISSKYINDKCKTWNYEIFRKKQRQYFFFFLDMSPQAMEKRAEVNKWGCIKLKSFYIANEAVDKMKICPPEWKDIFPFARTWYISNDIFNKGLISKIYKEPI